MRNYLRETLSSWKRMFLASAGVSALAVPLVVGVLAASRLMAQAPAGQLPGSGGDRPKFEAASIKPSKPGSQGTYLRRQPGGLYMATNASLRALIASAYLNEFPPKGESIFGGPGWIDSEHFEIEARAEGNPGNEQMRLMVESLLEDRFKLMMHHETRQLPIYALVVAKPRKIGPQLTQHSGDTKCADPAAGKPLPQPNPGEAMPSYCGGFFMNPRPGDLRETGNRITLDMLGSS